MRFSCYFSTFLFGVSVLATQLSYAQEPIAIVFSITDESGRLSKVNPGLELLSDDPEYRIGFISFPGDPIDGFIPMEATYSSKEPIRFHYKYEHRTLYVRVSQSAEFPVLVKLRYVPSLGDDDPQEIATMWIRQPMTVYALSVTTEPPQTDNPD